MQSVIGSLRVAAATIAFCVAGYTAVILGVAQGLTPETANGSLITTADGTVIGSRLIAQRFTDARYFWARPSAVDYNGGGSGGSNKSPTSTDLTARAEQILARYDASAADPLPPELAAASGGGLDPHISEHAASYQAGRIASARGIERSAVEALIGERAFRPGGPLTPDRIVNVLELNLALDSIVPAR
jgi:potassium-transporting ATPase KdpC subunit